MERFGWRLAIVLLVICTFLGFHLLERAQQSARVPVFMPMVDAAAPAPGPAPDAPAAATPQPAPPAAGDRTMTPPDAPPAPTRPPDNASLELAGVETMNILRQAGRLGPTVSLEDLVRGLLLLESESGAPALSERQKKRLLPIVRRAFERRGELLEIEREIRALEEQLPRQAAAVLEQLLPAQRDAIRRSRDEVSLAEFEDPYWRELLAALESR